MADKSSRTLLGMPSQGFVKPYGASNGARSTYKQPFITLSLLLILVACIAGAVVILVASHGDPIQAWKIRPAVWLSILVGVYVIALGALFSTGVAVIWWRCIAHGTTLERLHFVYEVRSVTNLFPAFLAHWQARRVAVAALLVFATKLAIGPMLQQTTRPELHEATRDISFSMDIASEIPDSWFTLGGASKNGISTSQAAFFGEDITTSNTTNHLCPNSGTCRGLVKAAGLNLWNTTTSTTLNLLDSANSNGTLFSIDLSINSDFGVPILLLETRFVSEIDDNCIATVTVETYGMIPATMHYPITIQSNRILPDILSVIEDPVIISNSSDANGTSSVLQGLLDALRPIYVSKSVLDLPKEEKPAGYAPAVGKDLNGFYPDMFANTGVFAGSKYPENVVKYCPLLWEPPTKYVMSQILGYTFRTARAVAGQRKDRQDRQDFMAVYTAEELWYVTSFRWLAASVAVMVLGMVAALSLSWGWWQLDRYVTLSPLETGKALGAPIVGKAGAEQEANSIIRVVGHELVAYDGNELIWAGSLYTSGVGSKRTSPRSIRSSDEPGDVDVSSADPPGNNFSARQQRKTARSLNEADPIHVTRTFEHDHGYTTRAPYRDEEETDIGQYDRPWASGQVNDNVPLIQMLSNIAAPGNNSRHERIQQQPSVPSPTSMQLRSLNQKKKPKRVSMRSSLPSIEERETLTRDGSWK
ncbi:hypothetical protein P171DRAFT_148098 [Karstenula rhodostoma CBS 690.94]|uniref:Uncharacterized protein n=1 Tax=Karstenula rhodostoma CBS 690.94 TaxID=1392251 RepID=A0A9P4UI49_9PLEO|nr:hypothetical protein P171DRAFT_148098 [Karstenula rhodostoma CBS 690.94]